MKKIITNNNNLKEEDITEIEIRVKVLLINSNNEILLGYSHNNYQFPGGHVEKGEPLIQTINREITEETGMELKIENVEPFAYRIDYYKDYPSEGKNRKNEIYYYEVKTDEKPNLNNTNYTEDEKFGNFELRYIPLTNVEKVVKENMEKYQNTSGIEQEMLDLFKIYINK